MIQKMALMIGVLAATLALAGGEVRAADGTMLSKATPEQQVLFAKIKTEILREAQSEKPLVLTETGEEYFWLVAGRLIPLMRGYAYSHDAAFIEAYVPLQEQVLGQRYKHPTKPEWNGWFDYKDGNHFALLDHETIVYYVPALMFVQEVRADSKLKAKYGEQAEKWLKDVEQSMRGWDKRGCWHEFPGGAGWYTQMTHYPDPKSGQLMPMGGEAALHAGGQVPYNKVHAFFQALSLAYQITGDDWYKTRMEKCAKFFRAHWRVDDKHAEWNYRDHSFPSDYVDGVVGKGKTKTGAFIHPKGGYYALDVEGVVWAYDVGAFFGKKDIEKLLQTNLGFMFMGNAKDPQFKMINGERKEDGKYNKGYLWTALSHFSQKVRDLWKVDLDRDRGKNWMWWSDDLEYLIETSQPVSWDQRNAKPAGKAKAAAK